MKRYYSFLLLCFILIIPFKAYQQELTTDTSRIKHGFGLVAGFTMGLGPAYTLIANNWRIQASFSPNVRSNRTAINTGLSLIKQINQGKFINALFFQSNSFIYESRTYSGKRTEQNILSHALGLGLEVEFLDQLKIFGLSGYRLSDYENLGLTVEVGFMYKL